MSNTKNYDFLIIGAGIVGLTIARELIERYPNASIAVLEKENQIGLHASGRNSGVLHSGIYYPKDSLKAKVCQEGSKRMMAFADEYRIPYSKIGKVIIATKPEDLSSIDFLLHNANQNQVKAQRLNEEEIKKFEPYSSPYQCGIYTEDTACIDGKKVLSQLCEELKKKNVSIYLEQEVRNVYKKNKIIRCNTEHFSYGYVFNAAGSNTDKIAKQFDLSNDYALLPFKGIYYKLAKEKQHMVNSNIYPVPDLNLPFLGVHFSKNIHGDVYVGPTAIPAFGRENYGLLQGMSFEAIRIMKDIALMYMANHQHFRALIHTEMKKYIKSYFIQNAKRLVSSIEASDLVASNKVGIRPQLINIRKRKIEMDYIIEQDNNSLHVLNAISPAFTGSFCFAEMLVNRIENLNKGQSHV